MAAIPWKARRRRSENDRIDRLTRENRRLRQKMSRIKNETLREICRRIDRERYLTLQGLKVQLIQQVRQAENEGR